MLLQGDEFFTKAFFELHTCRSTGMGAGPIPWDKIRDYALWHRIDYDFIEDFINIIRQMDNTFLEWDAEEHKRKQNLKHDPSK